MKKFIKNLCLAASVAALTVGAAASASAAQTKLRIQTHFSTETLSGQLAGEFLEDIKAMSNGEIEVEMFYSSAVVKSAETFDAAATGILDCDMTGGAYQTAQKPGVPVCRRSDGRISESLSADGMAYSRRWI